MQLMPEAFPEDQDLWSDFKALCEFGGRLTGTPSEVASRDWAANRLGQLEPGQLIRTPVTYTGWTCSRAILQLAATSAPLEATALLCSGDTPADGLELEVVDCGRGTPDDIRAVGDRLRGQAALVRHDYMFATTTVHRRVKLAAAIEAGAAAFLIAATEPGIGSVSGSSGLVDSTRRIPALGISAEAAEMLGVPGTKVRIAVTAAFAPQAKTETICFDIPGAGPDRVVLSAHIDGHAAGTSALDNASGVALALALARQAAPYVSGCPRGLTIALFSAEEWALTGSKEWLKGLSKPERCRMALNVNLDTVVGASSLTALTSGFSGLKPFLADAAKSAGVPLGFYEPLMPNSDHANFAAIGIPAFRLVSGFDEPRSDCRLVLTKFDHQDLVMREHFARPARLSWSILRAALTQSDSSLASLRTR